MKDQILVILSRLINVARQKGDEESADQLSECVRHVQGADIHAQSEIESLKRTNAMFGQALAEKERALSVETRRVVAEERQADALERIASAAETYTAITQAMMNLATDPDAMVEHAKRVADSFERTDRESGRVEP